MQHGALQVSGAPRRRKCREGRHRRAVHCKRGGWCRVSGLGLHRQLPKPPLRCVGKVLQQLAHSRAVRQLHARRLACACGELRPEARRVLLEREARQPGDRHLPLTHGGECGRAHAGSAHQRPLHAAGGRSACPHRDRPRVKTPVARRVVGLARVAEARAHRREERLRLRRRADSAAAQAPRAQRLWRMHPAHPARLHFAQQALVAGARCMQHTRSRADAHKRARVGRGGAVARHRRRDCTLPSEPHLLKALPVARRAAATRSEEDAWRATKS